MNSYSIGVIGLGVMGRNLALNIERNGYPVAGFDLDEKQRTSAAEKFTGKKMTVCPTLTEFVSLLESPKKILMMVPAGKPVDAVIQELIPHLAPG
ncbi:MAG TPA: NAD(P)-binding domain-containing protein, partial [bacterium]|nr:NAD(P)-binding domain-containing protein [bacterium]